MVQLSLIKHTIVSFFINSRTGVLAALLTCYAGENLLTTINSVKYQLTPDCLMDMSANLCQDYNWLCLNTLTIVTESPIDSVPTNVRYVYESGLQNYKLVYQVGLCKLID